MRQIIKGKQEKPMCFLFYGPKGVGKTSLAAQFPNPILIDIEKGASFIDIDKDQCDTFEDVKEALDAAINSDYKTIAIDSLDWLEQLIFDAIKKKYKTDSIEKAAGGYGKAYKEVLDLNREIKDILVKANKAGKHVVLIAHHRTKAYNNPMTETSYDRIEVKLFDGNAVSVKDFWTEYVDGLFFINEDTYTTGVGKEARAHSSGLFLFTKNSPAYDAKRRVDMPDKIEFKKEGMFDVLKEYFGDASSIDSLFKETLRQAEEMQDEELRKEILAKLPKYKNDKNKLLEIQKYIQGVAK